MAETIAQLTSSALRVAANARTPLDKPVRRRLQPRRVRDVRRDQDRRREAVPLLEVLGAAVLRARLPGQRVESGAQRRVQADQGGRGADQIGGVGHAGAVPGVRRAALRQGAAEPDAAKSRSHPDGEAAGCRRRRQEDQTRRRAGHAAQLHAAAAGAAPRRAPRAAGRGSHPAGKKYDVHARTFDGETPLHAVSQVGPDFVACMRLLLAHGADPNALDDSQITPLACAAHENCANVARVLLDGGTDPDLADYRGRLPIHKTFHKGIRKMLAEASEAKRRKKSEDVD